MVQQYFHLRRTFTVQVIPARRGCVFEAAGWHRQFASAPRPTSRFVSMNFLGGCARNENRRMLQMDKAKIRGGHF